MSAPLGAVVGIFYDGPALSPGDYLRTTTGRTYYVATVRVQRRGAHPGPQHLRCLVDAPPPPTARVFSLRWYARGRRADG